MRNKEIDLYIAAHYPNTPLREIANAVKLSQSQVQKIANQLGVERSEAYKREFGISREKYHH